MFNVNKRLRKVDRRIAQTNRRLGFLVARLYFQPMDGGWEEVSIFNAVDLGTSSQNRKTGEEVFAHRYQFTVDRDWLDTHTSIAGVWAIAPDGTTKLRATIEDQTVKESDTSGTLMFRIDQSIVLPDAPPSPFELP